MKKPKHFYRFKLYAWTETFVSKKKVRVVDAKTRVILLCFHFLSPCTTSWLLRPCFDTCLANSQLCADTVDCKVCLCYLWFVSCKFPHFMTNVMKGLSCWMYKLLSIERPMECWITYVIPISAFAFQHCKYEWWRRRPAHAEGSLRIYSISRCGKPKRGVLHLGGWVRG